MPNLFQRFIKRHLVDNVPDEMDLCLTCRKAHCSGAEYRNCEPRKARAAELVAARQV